MTELDRDVDEKSAAQGCCAGLILSSLLVPLCLLLLWFLAALIGVV